MFYYECMQYSDEIGQERMNQLQSAFDVQSVGKVEEPNLSASTNFGPKSNHNSSFFSYDGSDFFSILELQSVKQIENGEKMNLNRRIKTRGKDKREWNASIGVYLMDVEHIVAFLS